MSGNPAKVNLNRMTILNQLREALKRVSVSSEDQFEMLDRLERGEIFVDDFQHALRAYQIKISDELAEDIVREYDKDCSGGLNMDEFQGMLKSLDEVSMATKGPKVKIGGSPLR